MRGLGDDDDDDDDDEIMCNLHTLRVLGVWGWVGLSVCVAPGRRGGGRERFEATVTMGTVAMTVKRKGGADCYSDVPFSVEHPTFPP